jgi:MarR family transcriptional regulator, organic hydroperoxide resistance regulator
VTVATATADRRAALELLGLSFKGAMAAVRRLRGRDTHRPDELSHAQYQLLFDLAQRGELPAGELAWLADLSPASVTQMLDHLAAIGLVARERSARDRRIVVSRLTDAGRERCEERRGRIEPLWNAALEGFSARELRIAAAVLERLRELFDRLDEDAIGSR